MTKNKKITIALPTSTFLPNIGGVEVGLHNIAKNLKLLNIKVVVICSTKHYKSLKKKNICLPYNIETYPRFIGRLLKFNPYIAQLYINKCFNNLQKKYSFDIWHCTSGFPMGVLVSSYIKKNNIPGILRTVGSDIQKDESIGYGSRLNPKIDYMVKKSLFLFNKLVATTPTIEEEYKKIGIKNNKLLKITNGVDVNRFFLRNTNVSEIRNNLNIDNDEYVFICVGRNHIKKGFKYLIKSSLKLIDNSNKKFKVIFVGKNVNDLKKNIKDQSLYKYFIFIEPSNIDEDSSSDFSLPHNYIIDLYKSSNAFILPSLVESFGIVLIEAMASGLPIITTDSPGCRDIVKHGKNGILVEKGNSDKLYLAMHDYMHGKYNINQYIEYNLKDVLKYDYKNIVNKYSRAYNKILYKKDE